MTNSSSATRPSTSLTAKEAVQAWATAQKIAAQASAWAEVQGTPGAARDAAIAIAAVEEAAATAGAVLATASRYRPSLWLFKQEVFNLLRGKEKSQQVHWLYESIDSCSHFYGEGGPEVRYLNKILNKKIEKQKK
jgi:hypothetical protein